MAVKATPGPWNVGGDFVTGPSITPGYEHARTIVASTESDGEGKADAAYIAAASPTAILALLDRLDALETALHHCGLAAHFGGQIMDQRRRGGRDKLRYIEITADAALRGVLPVYPGSEASDSGEARDAD